MPPAPPADGRTTDEPDLPGRFSTIEALYLAWTDRDVRYAKADRALSEEQIASVRSYRKREVNDLAPEFRARAWARANAWYPPQHGQGRS